MSKFVALVAVAVLVAACTGPQVLNTFTPESGYDWAFNIPYAEDPDLKLDLYAPEDMPKAPVVIFFPGGRWSETEKQDYKFVGQALAARGIMTIIPNIRQYPEVRFPEFVADAARAVKWTHEHIHEYSGSPDRVFVMGHSSGAHVAAMLALNEQYLKDIGGSRTWLKGMIGLAGPYDFLPITAPDLRDLFGPPEDFVLSQPIYYVDGLNPPLLLLHGENDEVVEVRSTRNLARKVADSGGQVETIIYPRMSHAWIIGSLGTILRRGTDVLDHIVQFVKTQADAPPVTRRLDIQATPLPAEVLQTQPLVEP